MNDVVVRPAEMKDAEILPAIERSAGLAFRSIAELAWLADDDDLPVEFHRRLICRGTSWVAEEGGSLIGFLSAEVFFDELHIWELSVHFDRQRKGIGHKLAQRALAEASLRGLGAVTLTTFGNVPWNAPFYARLGFKILEGYDVSPRLSAILHAEIEQGLPREQRRAMRLSLK